jgi:hypothetical protein
MLISMAPCRKHVTPGRSSAVGWNWFSKTHLHATHFVQCYRAHCVIIWCWYCGAGEGLYRIHVYTHNTKSIHGTIEFSFMTYDNDCNVMYTRSLAEIALQFQVENLGFYIYLTLRFEIICDFQRWNLQWATVQHSGSTKSTISEIYCTWDVLDRISFATT